MSWMPTLSLKGYSVIKNTYIMQLAQTSGQTRIGAYSSRMTCNILFFFGPIYKLKVQVKLKLNKSDNYIKRW